MIRSVDIAGFQAVVSDYFKAHGRHDLPWRTQITPYTIVVSEIMLQQTQVSRVVPKFTEFVTNFPGWQELHNASTAEVIKAWQGLGYNRRALWLKEMAKQVVTDYSGSLPRSPSELQEFKGVGMNTAGSIAAFAYNQPVVFIETNIRRVFIYHFFKSDKDVSDATILPLVQKALSTSNPREWYWALMDYGTHLAKSVPNPNRKSKHYTKQSKFQGSTRQIRGEVLRQLLNQQTNILSLRSTIPDPRLESIVDSLHKEGFVDIVGDTIHLIGTKQ